MGPRECAAINFDLLGQFEEKNLNSFTFLTGGFL